MDSTRAVITIGRQFGSGGRSVARLVAESLKIPYYDKELLSLAAKQSGICEEMFETFDEAPTRSLLYSLVTGVQMRGDTAGMYMDMPLNHRVFLAQFDTIRRIASQGACVIVGRCADYVLRENPNAVNVFIHAPLERRVERAVKEYGVAEDGAREVVVKRDKQRASYYNYFADGTWGNVGNYHLCLDSACFTLADAADIVIDFVRRKEAKDRARG